MTAGTTTHVGGELGQIFIRDPNGVMIELNDEAARKTAGRVPVERRVVLTR